MSLEELLINQFNKELSSCRYLENLIISTYYNISKEHLEINIRLHLKYHYIPTVVIYLSPLFKILKNDDHFCYIIESFNLKSSYLEGVLNQWFERKLKDFNIDYPNLDKLEETFWAVYHHLPYTENDEDVRLWRELEKLPIDCEKILLDLTSSLKRRNDKLGQIRTWYLLDRIKANAEKIVETLSNKSVELLVKYREEHRRKDNP